MLIQILLTKWVLMLSPHLLKWNLLPHTSLTLLEEKCLLKLYKLKVLLLLHLLIGPHREFSQVLKIKDHVVLAGLSQLLVFLKVPTSFTKGLHSLLSLNKLLLVVFLKLITTVKDVMVVGLLELLLGLNQMVFPHNLLILTLELMELARASHLYSKTLLKQLLVIQYQHYKLLLMFNQYLLQLMLPSGVVIPVVFSPIALQPPLQLITLLLLLVTTQVINGKLEILGELHGVNLVTLPLLQETHAVFLTTQLLQRHDHDSMCDLYLAIKNFSLTFKFKIRYFFNNLLKEK